MGLEDDGYLLVLVQLADGLHALGYFGRVVGVIAEEYNPVVLQLEVEAAVHSAEACHALLDFFVGGTAEMGECHGGNTILDVDADGNTQLNIVDAGVRRHEVDEDFTVSDADILGMEVAFVARVGIGGYPRLYVGLHLQPFVQNQGTARLDKRGVVAEAFEIGFFGAVYIQVVGVGGSNDTHPGR